MTPARITGAFRVEEAGISRGGRACVRLIDPLEYHVGHAESLEVITVPAGFVTDFASIPWGLWNVFNPMGPWARPSIIHDFLYETMGTGWWSDPKTPPAKYIRGPRPVLCRAEADAIFREAMGVVEPPVGWLAREIMYRAVRLGGGGGWGR